jgi:hypothetical protein
LNDPVNDGEPAAHPATIVCRGEKCRLGMIMDHKIEEASVEGYIVTQKYFCVNANKKGKGKTLAFGFNA